MKRETDLLVRYLSRLWPQSVQSRLLTRTSLPTRYDLQPQGIMLLGDFGARFAQNVLFRAVRECLAGGGEQSLRDLSGREFRVSRSERVVTIALAPTSDAVEALELDEFMLLSANTEERVASLERLLASFGPTSPDFASFREEARRRELSDQEVADVMDEAINGVRARHRVAANAMAAGEATLDHLVPMTFSYYERFCGPDPGGTDPEHYIGVSLLEHRRTLLAKELVGGLEVCLIGYLRDDLSPGALVQRNGDEELWVALTQLEPERDPLSLLAALDVSLYRQHDPRYVELAERAATKLTAASFVRSDGVDVYELIPAFAQLVLDRLNSLEGGAVRPPVWKRMCAWMQAALLARWSEAIPINPEKLRNWVLENRTLLGAYANVLDLRREPIFIAAEFSPRAFRRQVVRQLVSIKRRHEAHGRRVAHFEQIEAAATDMVRSDGPAALRFPGPLEGHGGILRTREKERIAEADISAIQAGLDQNPTGSSWSLLALYSQLYDLSEEGNVLARAREACSRVRIEPDTRTEAHARLGDGALAAASLRDVELAKAIWRAILSSASTSDSDDDAVRMLQTLLIASAAFVDDHEWERWLEEQLVELVSRLPASRVGRIALCMKRLREVLPWAKGIHWRAEAIALAGPDSVFSA